MASVSLSSAINANFIRKLAAASNSDSPANTFKTNAIGGSNDKIDFTTALRFGAKTYTKALQNLNSGISLINSSAFNLERLIQVTKKVIDLTEQATSPGVGEQSRRKISSQIQEQSFAFRKIISDAKVGDYEFLDVDSLSGFFAKVGLDPEKAESLAKVFAKFILRPEDSLLASEKVDNAKQVSIPSSAFQTGGTRYALSKTTDANLNPGSNVQAGGAVASGYSVYTATDGVNRLYFKNDAGVVTDTGASFNVDELLSVNPRTGYALVSSTSDPLGNNSQGQPQLFLVGPDGTIQHQYTNRPDPGVPDGYQITGAAFSDDGLSVVYSSSTSTDFSVSKVAAGTLGNFGSNTESLIETNLTGGYESLAMSASGAYAAYVRSDTGNVFLRSSGGTGAADVTLSALTDGRSIGFLDGDEVAVLRSATGVSTTSDWSVSKFRVGDIALSALQSGLSVSSFTTVQGAGSGATGYFSIYEDNLNQIRTYDETQLVSSQSLEVADAPAFLSLALDSSSRPKLGVSGVIRSVNGDTNTELYTVKADTALSTVTKKWDEIFDATRTIVRKSDAYQMKADAKDMLRVLEANQKTILETRDVVLQNAQLLRASGLAFLSVAQSVGANDTAEQIAQRVSSLIREAAGQALTQAQNLNPLTVAALTNNKL